MKTSARGNTQCRQVDKWRQDDSYQAARQVFRCTNVIRSVSELRAFVCWKMAPSGSAHDNVQRRYSL